MIYNAEIRGFLGYYALADNVKLVGTITSLAHHEQFLTNSGKQTPEYT